MADNYKQKICHITTVHRPFDARIYFKECRTLAKTGFETTLIAQHDKEEHVGGVRIIPLSKPKSKLDRRVRLTLSAFLKGMKQNASIYHFHDPELIPAGILLKVFGKKVIYDMHEYFSEDIARRFGGTRGTEFRKKMLRFFLEQIPRMLFDRIIFPTISLAQAVDSNSRGLTLVNFPTLEEIAKFDDKFRWQDKDYDIIHLGTVTPPRMQIMLQIAKELSKHNRKFKWLFLGIYEETIDWVLKNWDHEFISNYIVMVTSVPYVEALGYIKRSRIGFNYHPYEKRFMVAIPMKVFEYMMMGLPVISTALPELQRYLTDGVDSLLIKSQNPSDYSMAMAQLLSHPHEAEELGFLGRAKVLGQLNWEYSEAGKLIDAYQNLLREENDG